MCDKDEKINHILSESSKLAQIKNDTIYEWVGNVN